MLANIRNEYNLQALEEKDLKDNPVELAQEWLKLAIEKQVYEPTAMTLSTVSKDLKPSSRIILLKDIQSDGFVFFTNYKSKKGSDIEFNPNVALLLFWKELERQVRIQGVCERISKEDSDVYFNSRPLGSRIGAIISPQSSVIPNREYLEKKVEDWNTKQEEEIKRPEHWGGYIVRPDLIEFWQGRTSRLHDRFLYELTDGVWKRCRLAP